MQARDIPLSALLERAERERDRLLSSNPAAPRFRDCEANGVARMDAVVSWLSRVPGCEWVDEYLERPHFRLPEAR